MRCFHAKWHQDLKAMWHAAITKRKKTNAIFHHSIQFAAITRSQLPKNTMNMATILRISHGHICLCPESRVKSCKPRRVTRTFRSALFNVTVPHVGTLIRYFWNWINFRCEIRDRRIMDQRANTATPISFRWHNAGLIPKRTLKWTVTNKPPFKTLSLMSENSAKGCECVCRIVMWFYCKVITICYILR